MALVANSFAKCAPAISSNIIQCGSVTVCQAVPLQIADLDTVYMTGNEFRVMRGLLEQDMEIKMCGAVQNGLYDFLMANKVNMNKRVQSTRLNSGLIDIAPFIMGRQYSPINNEYWQVGNGRASGGNWIVEVSSPTGIPMDSRSFIIGQRVYILGQTAGGSKTTTAWTISTFTDNLDGTADLLLIPQNSQSALTPDQTATPVAGLLVRGTINVSDFEEFCQEAPAYLNWKNVPFWVETTRSSLCRSSNYDKWRAMLLEDNPLYREFGDLDDIERNKQLGADYQKRIVNNIFYSKPLQYQDLSDYTNLPLIEAYDGSAYGLGVDGSTCQARRANVVGIYEQLAECNAIADLQGGVLNLPNLFRSLYNIMRVRKANGSKSAESIDIFTDSVFAELFNEAMITYYASKGVDSNGNTLLRLNLGIDSQPKTAEFGFKFRSYKLFWPAITINIITHDFFDDYLSAAQLVGQANTARVLWILDFAGIYPGVLATNKQVHKTGDLKTLAAVNPDFACVMKIPTREQTLTSMTYAVVVECPQSNLVVENFALTKPTITDDGVSTYPSNQSTTTTTTYH